MRYGHNLIPLCALLLAAGAGCQQHPRRPLDEIAHRIDYESRAHAQTDSPSALSLIELESSAMDFNSALRERRELVKLAEADAATAGLWPDPALGVSIERMLKGEGALWSVGGIFSLEIPISGVPQRRELLAQSRLEAVKRSLRAAEWETRARVRSAFVEYSRTIAKTQVLDELAARLTELEQRTERIAAAGEMTRISKRMFNIEAGMVRAESSRMMSEVDVMRLRVLAIAGLPSSVRISPDPGFGTPVQESAEISPIHPELEMARAEFEVAERELELELRMQYPDLMLGGGPLFEGSDRSAMGEFSIPLPLWNANRGGIARALAMRERERVKFEGVRERLENQAATAKAMILARRVELDSMEQSVLPLADAQLNDVLVMTQVGKVEPTMMLEALRQAAEIKMKIIDARADCALAGVELVMNTYQQQGGAQ